MAIWSNTTKTEKGIALEQKLLTLSKPLKLVAAKSGAGTVNPTQLARLTNLQQPKQELELRPIYLSEENTVTVPVMLSNTGLTEGYNLFQVGIYAEDPDDGEILYIIAQTDIASGERVPSAAESPGYSIDWNFAIRTSLSSSIEVVVNEAGKLTMTQADARYVQTEEMNQALFGKVDKAKGKGLSSNDFDDAYKAKLDGLETEFGKYETKSTMIAATISASGWSNGQYSFEDSYPNATYDLSVEPDSTCTEAQLDAWSGARIVGSSTGNVLKAFGDVPAVDIPVILGVKKK
ncbi:hypothetical protein AALA24_02070 [Anaerovoracaceae bacterium 42-11]